MPFVHFTNSSSLIFLPRTEFVICSINTMLYRYRIAPMSGEISGGGIQGFLEPTTSFAKLNQDGSYNFETLYKNYGSLMWKPWQSREELEMVLIYHSTQDSSLIQLKPFIIHLLRHKQMGQLPEMSLDVKEAFLQNLYFNSDRVKRHFIAIYATARFISLSKGQPKEMNYYNDDSLIDNLYKKITPGFLELSDRGQLAHLQSLALPGRYEIVDVLTQSHPEAFDQCEYDVHFSFAARFPGDSRVMTFILDSIKALGNIPKVSYFKEKVSATIAEINQAVALCTDILNDKYECLLGSDLRKMVHVAFPIAFVLEEPQSFLLRNIRANEYRNIVPLQLGQNILSIATDDSHVAELTEFCYQFQALKNLKIISFDALHSRAERVEEKGYSSASLSPLRKGSMFTPLQEKPKVRVDNKPGYCVLL